MWWKGRCMRRRDEINGTVPPRTNPDLTDAIQLKFRSSNAIERAEAMALMYNNAFRRLQRMSKAQRVLFNTQQARWHDSQPQLTASGKQRPEALTRGRLMFKYRRKRDRYFKAQSELQDQAEDVGLAKSVAMRQELIKSHIYHCVANKRDGVPTQSSIYRYSPGEAVVSCPNVSILQLRAHKAWQVAD